MIKYKLKSYDYLMHSAYGRIVDGKLFDENLKPYKKDFLEKILNYLEDNEMYEDCHFLQRVIKERFDHDLNYKNISI